MNIIKKNKNNYDMKELYKVLNKLIKEDRLKFYFNNNINKIELIKICHNRVEDTIEFEFRNNIAEYIEEMKQFINTMKK